MNTTAYFSREVISYVHEDREGNLILGTFGNGLIVVPNERTLDIKLPFDEDVSSITSSDEGEVYLGTRSGKVYKADSTGISIIRDDEGKRVETLRLFSYGQLLIDDEFGVLLDTKTGEETKLNVGSVKDAVEVDKNTLLVASNMGSFWVDRKSGVEKRSDELPMRYYSVGYDSATGSVYSSTAQGFFITQDSSTISELKLNDRSLNARDFESVNDKVMVATRDQGLVVFQKDTVLSVVDMRNELISNNIRSVKLIDDKILLATSKGVQILDSNLNSIQIVRASDGLASELILDVELVDDQLWVLHRKGAQTIDLNYLNNQSFEPELGLANVLVNDSSVAAYSKVNFSSDERNFMFELNVANLRYQKGITYEYKLEGADESWQTKSFQDHVIQYQSLSPGSYTFRAKAIYRESQSEEVTYSFSIAAPFYLTWWFYSLISLGLIALVALWFYRRLKQQAVLAQQQNELNASKLTAIQSQMNPHFIFNALNSIQDLVLKGDVANSYSYITKFADLVRRTLRYSDKNFVEFESEIKLIELYLTLEKLRFKEDFEYEINSDGVEDILVPPMLIQPFIENALVHGLLHKSGSKRLVLDFELGESLVCSITDNGVGRAKAKEIKERQRGSHESFSVNAIKKRFDILQRNFGGKLGFVIDDLTEGGEPTGTRVRLSIPIKRKF